MTIEDLPIARHNGAVTHAANGGDIIHSYAAQLGLDGGRFYQTLVQTMFPGGSRATVEQVQALCIVAREYGLNPFTRQIWAFPGKGGGVVPIVSVDGWIQLIQNRQELEGIEIDVEMEDDKKTPISATCRIHRKGWKMPVEVTEYLHEVKRNTQPWNTQPVRMLRHRALIQAARYAFGFSGIYEPDEGARFSASASPEHEEPRDAEYDVADEMNAEIEARKARSETKEAVHKDAQAAEAEKQAAPTVDPEKAAAARARAVAKVREELTRIDLPEAVLECHLQRKLDEVTRDDLGRIKAVIDGIDAGKEPQDVLSEEAVQFYLGNSDTYITVDQPEPTPAQQESFEAFAGQDEAVSGYDQEGA